jgi:phosphoenolpyruvate-protein phosphotransferase
VEGYGVGPAFIYRDILSREVELRDLTPEQVEPEWQRLKDALETVRRDLKGIQAQTQTHSGQTRSIFAAHETILSDHGLLARLKAEIQDKRLNSEVVVRNVFGEFERHFRQLSNKAFQEKAHDFHDLAVRILKVLTGVGENPLAKLPPNAVIFTHRLLPSDTVHFTERRPSGIVTEEGGPHSHSALIARSLRVPLITKVSLETEGIQDGDPTIVDGHSGLVILHPHETDISEYHERQDLEASQSVEQTRRCHQKDRSLHQQHFMVMANVALFEDVQTALGFDCDGIGLFRTEAIYMLANAKPSEEDIYRQLDQALARLPGKEVVLRLADLGGDKILSYFDIGPEHSSILGLRGIRFLLQYPAFLNEQLRAFLRLAAKYDVKILIPMVTTPWDVQRTAEALQNALDQLRREGLAAATAPLGAMIETPAAIWAIDAILPHTDFLSIGTNDLVQYATAADRENLAVWDYYRFGNELVSEVITTIIAKARSRNIECTLCGEIAGDITYTERLQKAGLKRFSVQPPLIPAVKNKIAALLEGEECRL